MMLACTQKAMDGQQKVGCAPFGIDPSPG